MRSVEQDVSGQGESGMNGAASGAAVWSAGMAALYRSTAIRSGWRSISGMGSRGHVRRRSSEAWYQEYLEPENKERNPPSKTKAKKSSILRDPGVVIVEKMSKKSLCKHLAQNVVYKKGPLVAITKPQGLPITGSPEGLSLVSVLPELQEILQMKSDLHVVKAAPKESSGLVLLSACHVTTKKCEEFYAECRNLKRPITTYCAITLGVPSPPEGGINVALTVENIGDLDLVVPVWHPSKRRLERREVKRTETQYKVLHSAEGCSLLELQPMSVYREQLLVHCTLQFCPILGDHTYSAQVAKVLGKNIYTPLDLATPRPQRIEEKILQKMNITKQLVHRIPLHLHLRELLILAGPSETYPTHLTAPPPPFFLRTMQLLRLKVESRRTVKEQNT